MTLDLLSMPTPTARHVRSVAEVHCVMYCVCMMYCDLTTRYMWSGDMWEGGEGRQLLSQTLHSVPWPRAGSDKML